jgi:hypothetical protein
MHYHMRQKVVGQCPAAEQQRNRSCAPLELPDLKIKEAEVPQRVDGVVHLAPLRQ